VIAAPVAPAEPPKPIDPEEVAAVNELVGPIEEFEPLGVIGLEDEDEDAPRSQATPSSDNGRDDGRRGRRGRGRGNDRGSDRGDRRGRDDRGSDRRSRDSRDERPAAPVAPAPKPKPVVHDMAKLYVNIGRGAFPSTEALHNWLAFMTGLDAPDFGSAELDRTATIVEVRQDLLYDVIGALNGQDWEGKQLSVRPWRPK
jgi:hypothetical protein